MRINAVVILAAIAFDGLAEAKTIRGKDLDDEALSLADFQRRIMSDPADTVDVGEETTQELLPEEVMLKLAELDELDGLSSMRDIIVINDSPPTGQRMLQPPVPDDPSDSTETAQPKSYNVFYRNSCYEKIKSYIFYKRGNNWYERSLKLQPYSAAWIAKPDYRHFYTCATSQNNYWNCWNHIKVPKGKKHWIHEFQCY